MMHMIIYSTTQRMYEIKVSALINRGKQKLFI